MAYGDRWFPATEYEGVQVPEAYPHDPEVLPHQRENLEELFPKAFVPQPAGEEEMLSEPNPLEDRGTAVGRREARRQATTAPVQSALCGEREARVAVSLRAGDVLPAEPLMEVSRLPVGPEEGRHSSAAEL